MCSRMLVQFSNLTLDKRGFLFLPNVSCHYCDLLEKIPFQEKKWLYQPYIHWIICITNKVRQAKDWMNFFVVIYVVVSKSHQWFKMLATSFKTFVAFGLISIGLNVIILGPNGFKNQVLVAFYEKPELTIYPSGLHLNQLCQGSCHMCDGQGMPKHTW